MNGPVPYLKANLQQTVALVVLEVMAAVTAISFPPQKLLRRPVPAVFRAPGI